MRVPITIHCVCGVDYDAAVSAARWLRCPCCGHVWDLTPPPWEGKYQPLTGRAAGFDGRCRWPRGQRSIP